MPLYAAQIDPAADREVLRCCVVPDGEADPAAYMAGLVGGEWITMAGKEAGPGWVHQEGIFCIRWFQIPGAATGPDGAESGFREGARLYHAGHVWVSTVDVNVWEPGVANWHRLDGTWIAPTGSTDAYALGEEVFHAGQWWRSIYDANVWEPGVAGWEAA